MSNVPPGFIEAASQYLPVFDLRNTSVVASDARHDKIDLYIGEWFIPLHSDFHDEARQFCNHLGGPPLHYNREIITRTHEAGHEGAYGYLFNRVNLSERDRFWAQKVRQDVLRTADSHSSDTEVVHAPLFSGKMRWRTRSESTRNATGSLYGSLDANLNVTRFARYRSGEGDLPSAILKWDNDMRSRFGEICFEGQDNWIPLVSRLFARLKPSNWPILVRNYLDLVSAAVNAEIQRACRVIPESFGPLGERSATFSQTYTLKRVETYWEFLSENPTALVRSLCRPLQTWAGRKFYHREYKHPELNQDSVLIAADTVRGENLKIYAKTNYRIRIEVRHTLIGNEAFQFSRSRTEDGEVTRSTSHRFNSTATIVPFLERLQEQSADIVNNFLQFVATRNPRTVPTLTGYDALFRIVSMLPRNYVEARTIVQLLAENGSVTKRGQPQNFQHCVDTLKQNCILKYEARARKYVLAPMYEHAIEAFKTSWEPPVATGRVRTRSS